MRIYNESTIPSYIVARPANNLLQSAHQCVTREWWDNQRSMHELYTSQLVLDEISQGDADASQLRAGVLAEVPILQLTQTASDLAARILDSRLLTASADRDALHIAPSAVHNLDILLTWNCRHIANPFIQSSLMRVVEASGYKLPVLSTPETIMELEV